MEMPYAFSLKNQQFFLYPMTLGKSFLVSRILKVLDINEELLRTNPYKEALRLCHQDTDNVCLLIAYHTFNRKEDLCDPLKVSARAKRFAKVLDKEDMAQLLTLVTAPDKTERFMKDLGITDEKKWQRKAMKAKEDSDSLTFGGKSIYGTLIDFACERYGWTMDYVVWGISHTNLQMLMADMHTTIYLSKEERKKVHIPKDRTKINADDPKNMEKIKALFNG